MVFTPVAVAELILYASSTGFFSALTTQRYFFEVVFLVLLFLKVTLTTVLSELVSYPLFFREEGKIFLTYLWSGKKRGVQKIELKNRFYFRGKIWFMQDILTKNILMRQRIESHWTLKHSIKHGRMTKVSQQHVQADVFWYSQKKEKGVNHWWKSSHKNKFAAYLWRYGSWLYQ